jgi:hypothetical protein
MVEKNIGSLALTVNQMVDQLSHAYVSLINSNIPLKRFPSVMLWGPPGVGKSQGIRQVAKQIEEKTDKRVHITDVRLLLFNPVDLRGIPTANADKTLAIWLKPQIFQMDSSPEVVNILFLDEISAAPQSVQAAAYQITLDRTVGEHKLPDNCIVIAAGNRTTDQSVSYKMPKALCNRLMHFNIVTDFEGWRAWAIKNDIDPKIIGFLGFDNSRLCAEPDSSELAFCTPRSWSFVSTVLSACEDTDTDTFDLIASCIGNDAEAREGLKKCTGMLRHHLATTLNLRITPELTFTKDGSIEHGARIAKLLDEINKDKEQ